MPSAPEPVPSKAKTATITLTKNDDDTWAWETVVVDDKQTEHSRSGSCLDKVDAKRTAESAAFAIKDEIEATPGDSEEYTLDLT